MDSEYRVVRPSVLRKVIAARMEEATRTIPHFRMTSDIDATGLMEARERWQAHAGVCPSLNDLIVKACANALMQTPTINIQFVDGEIRQFAHAHVSIVIAIEGGLVAPVVRNADQKSVEEIAAEMKDFSARAAARTLKMHELEGGAFSISNLGKFDVDQFDAIINPPQCAILALGRIKERAVASAGGGVRAAPTLRTTLSLDHRSLDGIDGARFMTALRKELETCETWAR